MQTIERIVREHPFFQGLDEASSTLIAGCARNAVFHVGEHLFRGVPSVGVRESTAPPRLPSGPGHLDREDGTWPPTRAAPSG